MPTRVHVGLSDRIDAALLDWLPTSEFAVSVREHAAHTVELVGEPTGSPAAAAVVVEGRPTLSGAPVLLACAAPVGEAGRASPDGSGTAELVEGIMEALSGADHLEVVGPAGTARPVADGLAARTGGVVSLVIGERLMVATEAVVPDVDGAPRRATTADHPVLAGWLHAFALEALGTTDEFAAGWASAVDNPTWDLWVWEVAGEPVSLVNHRRTTPVSSRIGPVYTPPEQRGRGYAGALTARVTEELLAAGDPCVTLFTDETNATSNALYARIGYRDVGAQGGWEVRRG